MIDVAVICDDERNVPGLTDSLVFALIFFGLFSLSGRPPHGYHAGPKPILLFMVQAYVGVFFGFYLAVRVLSPEQLLEAGRLADGWLWLRSTGAWAGLVGGSYFGWWVRRIRRAQ